MFVFESEIPPCLPVTVFGCSSVDNQLARCWEMLPIVSKARPPLSGTCAHLKLPTAMELGEPSCGVMVDRTIVFLHSAEENVPTFHALGPYEEKKSYWGGEKLLFLEPFLAISLPNP